MEQLEGEQVGESNVGGEVVKAFDVSAYELEDTAVLTVQNLQRTDDLLYNDKPVLITVYSPGSKQGVRAMHKVGLAAQLRLRATFSGKVDKNAAQQADEEKTAKLVAITAQIENFPMPGGARELYSNPKLSDIGDQVDEFFSLKANFSKAGSAK